MMSGKNKIPTIAKAAALSSLPYLAKKTPPSEAPKKHTTTE
jgi:hypothetical protein